MTLTRIKKSTKLLNTNRHSAFEFQLGDGQPHWDSVLIYDVTISEEQDLVAYLLSDRGGSGERIDVRQYSTGKLIYRNFVNSEQNVAKKLKFINHGQRLIFDNRIILDSQSGNIIYEAPKPQSSSSWMYRSLIPIGGSKYLYLGYESSLKIFKAFIFDESNKVEKLMINRYLSTVYSVSLSKEKNKLAIATFDNSYEFDIYSGESRILFQKANYTERPEYLMYSENGEFIYVNNAKEKIIKEKP